MGLSPCGLDRTTRVSQVAGEPYGENLGEWEEFHGKIESTLFSNDFQERLTFLSLASPETQVRICSARFRDGFDTPCGGFLK